MAIIVPTKFWCKLSLIATPDKQVSCIVLNHSDIGAASIEYSREEYTATANTVDKVDTN